MITCAFVAIFCRGHVESLEGVFEDGSPSAADETSGEPHLER